MGKLKKFDTQLNEKKKLDDSLGNLADLRKGIVALRRFAALQAGAGAAAAVVLGTAEAADLAAIAVKVAALLADLDKNYPEALGN